MEDGLVLVTAYPDALPSDCLNPCCNGRWSRTCYVNEATIALHQCLNPCCNGRWSRTVISFERATTDSIVLILVVMEDGLVLDLIRLY